MHAVTLHAVTPQWEKLDSAQFSHWSVAEQPVLKTIFDGEKYIIFLEFPSLFCLSLLDKMRPETQKMP